MSRRGPVIHFIRPGASRVALCRAPDAFVVTTTPARVTCPRCLELLQGEDGKHGTPVRRRNVETVH
jgi:hypothetical protein